MDDAKELHVMDERVFIKGRGRSRIGLAVEDTTNWLIKLHENATIKYNKVAAFSQKHYDKSPLKPYIETGLGKVQRPVDQY